MITRTKDLAKFLPIIYSSRLSLFCHMITDHLLITAKTKLNWFVGPVYQSGCFFSSDSLRSQAYEKAIPTSPRACY